MKLNVCSAVIFYNSLVEKKISCAQAAGGLQAALPDPDQGLATTVAPEHPGLASC